MLKKKDDGKLQVTAAVTLLNTSQLVRWVHEDATFAPVTEDEFENSWPKFGRPFGRLICWILFSDGAEMLAKGVCLYQGVNIRRCRGQPDFPPDDFHAWMRDYPNYTEGNPIGKVNEVQVPDYGALGDLLTGWKSGGSKLHDVFKMSKAEDAHDKQKQGACVIAYDLLRWRIRNRDAHAYVANVRERHFKLVSVFADSFNLLIKCLDESPGTINQWLNEAQQLVREADPSVPCDPSTVSL